VWQFGGVDLEGVVYNTTHRWTPDDGWQLVDTRGTAPRARWTHSAVVHSNGMYVFGGFFGYGGSGSSGRLNDLWRLDLDTLQWQEVPLGEGSAPPPAVRSHHSATVLRDRMYIFGGADEQRVAANNGGRGGAAAGTGAFDWLNLGGGAGGAANGFAAPADAAPVAGGAPTSDEYVDILHNDLHEFEFATRKWRRVETSPLLPAPPGGITARLGVHRGLLYCLCWRALEDDEQTPYDLGPDAADGIILEMAVIDPAPGGGRATSVRGGSTRQDKLPAWRRVPFTGSPPRARDLFSSAVWQDAWILHAGRSVRGELLRDTHEFSFEARTWRPLTGRTTGGANTPDARYGHCAVVIGNVMYVVGGSNAAQQSAAPRALTQRCAAVEQLFLRRVVAPPEDYSPPVPVVAPRTPRQRALDAARLMARGARWCGVAAARAAGYQVSWPSQEEAAEETDDRAGDRTPARRIITSDVNLLVDGRRFHTHSDILAASSERFAAILARDATQVSYDAATQPLRRLEAWSISRGAPPAFVLLVHYILVLWSLLVRIVLTTRKTLFPKRPRRIAVRDISYDVALVMMHFAYAAPSDAVAPVPNALLEDAFIAAERYGMPRMRAACVKQLVRGVTPPTAARLAGLAHEFGSTELWDAAVRTAARNLPEVVQGPEFEMLWAKHGRVAQQLTADAAKELQGGAAGKNQQGRGGNGSVAYVPPAPDADAPQRKPSAPGDVFLSARTVALDGARAHMDAATQALSGMFGGGSAKPAATASNGNRARALR